MRPKTTLIKRSWGNKLSLLAGIAALTCSQANAQTYCAATNTSSSTYYIANVSSSGGITNFTNNGTTFSTGGYADYSATQVVLAPIGASITINAAGGPSGYTYVWNIWCDWNQDGDFDDPGESVFTQSSYIGSIAASITIPATANTGNIRMRVRDAYITPVPPACGSNTWGEAEDYTIRVAPPDNAAIGALLTPTSAPFCSNSTQTVTASLINHGSNALTTANIDWSVDGVMQPTYNFSGNLAAYGDYAVVTLGNVFFANTTPKAIRIWSSAPNGMVDPNHADDSIATTIAASLTGVEVSITPRDTIICSGSSVTLDAGGDHPVNPIYVWNTSQITQTINVTQSGTYSVWVQNSDGCFDRDTVHVAVHPDPVVNSIAIIDKENGKYTFNVIGAQNVTSFTWDFGDQSTNDGTVFAPIDHTYTTAGDYTVTLTLRNDCGEIVVTRKISTTGSAPTGVGNVSGLEKSISVYPNPSQSLVSVTAEGQVKMTAVSVYNLVGQKVFTNDKVNASKYEFNVAGFSTGIYNVIIETADGKVTKKLEVIR